MTVASFFRQYSVGCILNYVRLIITCEISFIYLQLLLKLCTELSQVTRQRNMASMEFRAVIYMSFKKKPNVV
jgi:hypothetical protein